MSIVVISTGSGATNAPLTTNEILDLALGKQHDTSSVMRAKAMGWLNSAIAMLLVEREWKFTETAVDLAIADNAILKPADYSTLRHIKNTDTSNLFFFADRHRLTEEEAFDLTSDDTTPAGFTETATNIIFHPGATGTVNLGYIKAVPTYADNETTIIPAKFKNLLARAVLSMVYEYEENSRALPSMQLDMVELSRLKKEENVEKPRPKRSKYLRGRI